jgi:peptide/nickel transport system substrate-binding protein
LLLGGVIIGGAAAAAGAATSGRSASSTSITIRMPFDATSLNPATASGSDGGEELLRFAYDGLVANVNGKIEPFLATKWVSTAKATTFTLAKGITCSDGSTLKPSDVAAYIAYVVKKSTGSPNVNSWLGGPGVKVQANDAAGTLRIQPQSPYGDLLSGIARMPIACPAGFNDPKKFSTGTFGTGPYVMSQSIPGSQYSFTKRSGYTWGPNRTNNNAAPDNVTLKVITDETTATNAFLAGQLDVTNANGPDLSRLESTNNIFQSILHAQEWNIAINHGTGHAGSDPNVRKGLVAAVNLNDLAKAIIGKSGQEPASLQLPGSACYDAAQVASSLPHYSTAQAMKYFAAAGYTMQNGSLSKDGTQLKVKVMVPSNIAPAADFLQAAWSKVGVKVDTVVAPQSQTDGVTQAGTGGDWDIGFITVSSSYPSYIYIALTGPPPPNGFNFSGIDNPVYTKLATAAREKPTQSVCAAWKTANRAILKAADWWPMAYLDTGWFAKKGISFLASPTLYGIYPSTLKVAT